MSKQPLLPIPELQETADRFLTWVKPLISAQQYQQTQARVKQFVDGDGQTLQKALRAFAEEKSHSSWLIDAWLESYLCVRDSLPLTTSGGFRLDLRYPDTGLMRVAYMIVGFAQQSADYFNDCLEPNLSPRQEPLDMYQWKPLQGIGRMPGADCDHYEMAPMDKQVRYVGVFWKNREFLVPVLDEHHRVYSAASIAKALEAIVAGQFSDQCDKPAVSAMTMSLAGGEEAHAFINEVRDNGENQANLLALSHTLINIYLDESFAETDNETLRNFSYLEKKRLWAYKPLTVCANLADNRLFAHLEHGWYDAGALQTMFARSEIVAATHAEGEQATVDLPVKLLQWQFTESQRATLGTWDRRHRQRAGQYRVDAAVVPVDGEKIPQRTSIDALMQFVLQYAQQQTFGKIRNTYEAVDVSHFQRGRTECIRPVSSESVAFVKALIKGKATAEQFSDAHAEHKNRIKACKRGHGVNRHLLGLRLMADKLGLQPALFDDVGYQTITYDFLSTSSLGDRRYMGDFAFVPTVIGGLGVSYFTTDEQDFLYCIAYHEQQQAIVEKFKHDLGEAGEKLMQFFS
ncbi:MAG: hypothetical protein CSA47_01490 [Gammaproteobacteria bacterium]|nr:MAG: hypothetical protein CSA47_01490 [Gammaproteobacteria bacterium]